MPRLGMGYDAHSSDAAISSTDMPFDDVFRSSNDYHELAPTNWFDHQANQGIFSPHPILPHQQQQQPQQQPQPDQRQYQPQSQHLTSHHNHLAPPNQHQQQPHHHHHHHHYSHDHSNYFQNQPFGGMDGSANTRTNSSTGQASCASSASCPWVLSPVPGPDGWSLAQCADIGCVPDVPDVEQCVPPTASTQSPIQSSPDAFPPPVPIDFTTSSSALTYSFDAPVPNSNNARQAQAPVSKVPASRKRRSSVVPTEESKPAPSAAKPKAPRPTKVAHSVVEQRYRDNINGKIAQLHKTLSTTKGSGSSSSDEAEAESMLPRTRKADVLASAIDYIKRAEKSRSTLENEVEFLKTRITTLEKLVKCEDCNVMNQMKAMTLQQAQFGM